MSKQLFHESGHPRRSIQLPVFIKDYDVQCVVQSSGPFTNSPIQHSLEQEEELQQRKRTFSDHSESPLLNSHCSTEARAQAMSIPFHHTDRQPDRQKATLQRFDSNEEEDNLFEEDEPSFLSMKCSLGVQDLKKQNAQLRKDHMVLRQEVQQLQDFRKDMQNLMLQQQLLALPAPQLQLTKEIPVPLPRTVYRIPVRATPSSWPYIPQPTQCRPQVTSEVSRIKPNPGTYTYKSRPPPFAPPNYTYSSPMGWLQSTVCPETSYRCPQPTIPCFIHRDQLTDGEFTRLKLALDKLLPDDANEFFKYQVLLDHLKFEEARLIGDSFLSSPQPYTDTIEALTDRFGRPHQLALNKVATVMDAPDIQPGDLACFGRFALQIQALVGLLKTLGTKGNVELQCGSHVTCLLTKHPPDLRASFRRHMPYQSGAVYTLLDLAEWLRFESWCQDCEGMNQRKKQRRRTMKPRPGSVIKSRFVTVLHEADQKSNMA